MEVVTKVEFSKLSVGDSFGFEDMVFVKRSEDEATADDGGLVEMYSDELVSIEL